MSYAKGEWGYCEYFGDYWVADKDGNPVATIKDLNESEFDDNTRKVGKLISAAPDLLEALEELLELSKETHFQYNDVLKQEKAQQAINKAKGV